MWFMVDIVISCCHQNIELITLLPSYAVKLTLNIHKESLILLTYRFTSGSIHITKQYIIVHHSSLQSKRSKKKKKKNAKAKFSNFYLFIHTFSTYSITFTKPNTNRKKMSLSPFCTRSFIFLQTICQQQRNS